MKNQILLLSILVLGVTKGIAFSEEKKHYLTFVTQKECEGVMLETYDLWPARSNIYGIYSENMGYTGGKSIHLFPDNTFAIVRYCDICMDETIGFGDFVFKNGVIIFMFDHFDPDEGRLDEEYNTMKVFNGMIDKGSYVTGFITILVDHERTDELIKEEQFFDYYRKGTPYIQWREVQKEMFNK